MKPRNAQEKGGIIEREASINVSNVMIICPSCNVATRVAHSISVDEKGKKIKTRICKKCGASLDVTASKASKTAKKATKKTATKSYIFFPLKVTLAPIVIPSLTLKLATLFLALHSAGA